MVTYALNDTDRDKAIASIARDPKLDAVEKGVLLTLLFLDEGEDGKVETLTAKYFACGKATIYKALRHLHETKYLVRTSNKGIYRPNERKSVLICINDKDIGKTKKGGTANGNA